MSSPVQSRTNNNRKGIYQITQNLSLIFPYFTQNKIHITKYHRTPYFSFNNKKKVTTSSALQSYKARNMADLLIKK